MALWISTLLVPKAYRDDFGRNLREEYEIIWRDFGPERARRWLRGQMLRSIPPCLRWRLERAIRSLWSKEFIARMVLILLLAYLLPAVLIGAMLYGVAIVIGSVVDAARQVGRPDRLGPGRVALWISTLLVPKAYRDDFGRNLREEYEIIRREEGLAAARRWFRGQVLRSTPLCLRWRLERAIRFLQSEELLPRLIHVALCVYLLPAVLAVALLSMIGIFICFLVDSSRRIPPMTVKLLEGVRSVTRKIVDILKKVFRRGRDRYRTWGAEFRPAGACVWPRPASLFLWIILG